MSPFGPAFVILTTRTLLTLLDEPCQLDELAENIGLASLCAKKYGNANAHLILIIICGPIYTILCLAQNFSILISVASGLLSSSRIASSLTLGNYWKRWKSVGFVNRPQCGVRRPCLGNGAGSGENVSYLWFDFCHWLIASLGPFQPQQHSVHWMRNSHHLVWKISLILLYHVPDVVLLFRQLRGWFELRVLSIFIVGGPCWFLGILGVLNCISFDYTDRTSTLPSSATVMTTASVSMQSHTQPQHNCDVCDSYFHVLTTSHCIRTWQYSFPPVAGNRDFVIAELPY